MAGERHGHGMLCVNPPLLSDVVVILFSSIVVLTPKGQFVDLPTLHSVSDMNVTQRMQRRGKKKAYGNCGLRFGPYEQLYFRTHCIVHFHVKCVYFDVISRMEFILSDVCSYSNYFFVRQVLPFSTTTKQTMYV